MIVKKIKIDKPDFLVNIMQEQKITKSKSKARRYLAMSIVRNFDNNEILGMGYKVDKSIKLKIGREEEKFKYYEIILENSPSKCEKKKN